MALEYKMKANRILSREHTGHSKYLLPTTQERTLYTWKSPDSQHHHQIDYMLPKREKLYIVSRN